MKLFKSMRELMAYTKEQNGEKCAFVIKEKDGTYTEKTFSDLVSDVNGLANYLIEKNLFGKPVALIGGNSYEWCLSFFATLCAGCLVIPLDNRLPVPEIERLFERSKPKAVIFSKNHTKTIENFDIATKICMGEKESFYEIINSGKALNPTLPEIDPEKPAILMFTSGTTSESKGVLLSQKNLLSNTRDLCDIDDFTVGYTYLSIIPLHHAFGCGAMTLFTVTGVKTVFPEGLRIAQGLEEYKVSLMVCVPAILNVMYKKIQSEIAAKGKTKTVAFGIKLSKFLRKFGIDIRRKLFREIIEPLGGELKFIISGAAALDPVINDFFNDIGINLIQGYGLSETSPVVSAERVGKQKKGSIGIPMTHVQVKIADKNEQGIGEIITRGDNVMLGYYENEEATKAVLKDGWFYTGDMGYIDSDGFIYITGRKKNVLVLENGKNVFPEELEQKIDALSGVKESLVYLADKNGKETMCARIVYDTDVYSDENIARTSIESLVHEMNSGLVSYKQIKHISLTDKPMEKTTTAKIKRNVELQKEL
ncbi:MAG: AMP-binding protein [Clostridia bacterium]|nr:AMP-binding protein [Clostridia bacterium]